MGHGLGFCNAICVLGMTDVSDVWKYPGTFHLGLQGTHVAHPKDPECLMIPREYHGGFSKTNREVVQVPK
jgi:hypothetical protein